MGWTVSALWVGPFPLYGLDRFRFMGWTVFAHPAPRSRVEPSLSGRAHKSPARLQHDTRDPSDT